MLLARARGVGKTGTMRSRFAPSPNGPLHLGHAYAAIVAHDVAHGPAGARGGEFLLRIEDIDPVRSRPEMVEGIFADLEWLGLRWDGEVVRQSRRLARYAEAGERLKGMGLLYPCCCSRARIAAASDGRMGPDGPLYPGTCKGGAVLAGGGVAWRLDMARAVEVARGLGANLDWEDEIAGVQRGTPEIFGDVVLLPKEAPASYHLAATLDDADDGVTLVTRGEDLFAASHLHRLLQALLGLAVPRWHHHALLLEKDGRKLAKRRGSGEQGFGLAERRLSGEDGRALAEALRAGRFPTGISLSPGVGSRA